RQWAIIASRVGVTCPPSPHRRRTARRTVALRGCARRRGCSRSPRPRLGPAGRTSAAGTSRRRAVASGRVACPAASPVPVGPPGSRLVPCLPPDPLVEGVNECPPPSPVGTFNQERRDLHVMHASRAARAPGG